MLLTTHRNWLRLISLLCATLLVPGDVRLMAQADAPASLPADQLDSLVAPIALYPDPLLAQVLAASTYPLELVQLQQWLAKHKDLKDKALAEAVQKQDWDPSVQAMAGLPDVVKQLVDNIKWTSELGNTFLAQQSGVMDAVQRMRAKAKGAGKLQSNEQMKIETKVVESKNVIVIEQAKPEVVYVPSYDPVVVWGAPPVYAYPPVAYPPGYYAAGVAISFGVGVAMGAMFSGGWGYGAGWGGNNNININNNNNFVRNNNSRNNIGNSVGSGNRGGGNSWQHNPQHRGGAPYGDRGTANKFGGSARGDSAGTRQSGIGNRSGGAAGGNVAANRNGGGNAGANRDRGGATSGNRGGTGGDRVGNRQVSGGSSGNRGAFGGAGGGGGAARSSGSRGASSMGGSRGGGRRR